MLTITLLGTAATMPLPDRALTAALAECGGHALLFDCGEGTQVGLRRYGVSAYRLSAVLLTHYHGDHILGLPGLLQTLGSLNRTEPLMIYGPKGIEPVAQAVTALAGPQAYPVRWQVADGPFHIETLKITPFPLTHRVPCCGYLLALPRAGRFDPARARAAGIPMPYWKTLQRGEAAEKRVFRHQIAYNLIPEIGGADGQGYTSEEMKMQNEGRKIMHLPELRVTCTCVRVPVMRSHSISASIVTERELTVDEVREAIAGAPGCVLEDDMERHIYPMPLFTGGLDTVAVGRIRRDIALKNGIALWCCGDQLRKGAATNTVQIAELLLEK